MRCDLCPLWPTGIDDTCPEMDGEYGIVHASRNRNDVKR